MLMLYVSFYSKKSELEMLKYLLLERYRAQGSSSATQRSIIVLICPSFFAGGSRLPGRSTWWTRWESTQSRRKGSSRRTRVATCQFFEEGEYFKIEIFQCLNCNILQLWDGPQQSDGGPGQVQDGSGGAEDPGRDKTSVLLQEGQRISFITLKVVKRKFF